MKHDLCYDKAVREDDCYDTAEEYLLPYNWKCIQGQPACLSNENSKCANAICACDSEVIKCWSRFEKPKIHTKCTKIYSTRYHHSHPSFRFSSLFNWQIFNILKAIVI
ncbi:Phospholipase A2 family protein [Acanthocheilonema viteae]